MLSVVAATPSQLPSGEGWKQVGELGLALVLSAVVGLERECRQKSAGLRTYTLVGVGSALFVLISKYGFMDVISSGRIVLDPSRVAAQIVSGVGFLGGGIIFVRRDAVRGLTTAAGVWVTAAIGTATGAGLPVLAAVTTVIYLVVAVVFPGIARRLPHVGTPDSVVRVRYPDGRGLLRDILHLATERGFTIGDLATQRAGPRSDRIGGKPMVDVVLHVSGRGPVHELASALSEVPEVDCVIVDDVSAANE